MSRRTLILSTAVSLGLALWLSPACAQSRSVTVTRVIDGDTIDVVSEGHHQRVRLIGIDTPESRNNQRSLIQANKANITKKEIIKMGSCAHSFTEALLPIGQQVTLVTDTQKRDKYRRTLAYVYLPNGQMVNEVIISQGYAYPLTIAPNVLYEKLFRQRFADSRKAERGLWSGNPSCTPVEYKESVNSISTTPMIE
jgi:micrococcal nuclease